MFKLSRIFVSVIVLCSLLSSSFALNLVQAEALEPQPGDPVVIGEPGLPRSVVVLPYDVDTYGLYLVEGEQMTPITNIPVTHINLDRVTAKIAPDGLKAAYLVEYGSTGFSKLVVIGVDGLHSSVLFESEDPQRSIGQYTWSHDSEHLAYSLSRDAFASLDPGLMSFEQPDSEVDPLEQTIGQDDPLAFTGEVWVADIDGEEFDQLVDRGSLDVLGWTADDTGVLFTRVMTRTTEPALTSAGVLTDSRHLTPTTVLASGVSVVETTAITEPTVIDLLDTSPPEVSESPAPVYTGFYLLEAANGQQKLATVTTPLPFVSLPYSGTVLSTMDMTALLSGTNRLSAQEFTTVVSSTDAIVNVALSPDGTRLAYMTEAQGGLWVADRDGLNHTEIVTGGLDASVPLIWDASSSALGSTALGSYQVQILDLQGGFLGSLATTRSEALEAEPLSARVVKQVDTPYVHQLWDTPNWFAGYCACGPSSTAMALAAYGKVSAHPITVDYPSRHTSNFGFYVAEKYGQFNSRWAWDCGSNLQAYHKGYGLYGFTMVSSTYRAAEYARIRDAIHKHGINTSQDWTPTFDDVKAAIDRGHVVIVGTRLTSAGHIVVIKGYTNDGRIVVHDPYGNFRSGSYGKYNGADSWYYWNDLTRYGRTNFNFIEVKGDPPSGGGSCGGGVPTITHWKGEYYNNRNLSGRPLLTRNDKNLSFDWGGGTPQSGCIPSDNFSVRWTRTMRFERGTYRFIAGADDGVRVYVDNKLVINAWRDQGFTTYTSENIYLSGSNHTIRMEYYENGGASAAKLSWQLVSSGSSSGGWHAQYYNNRSLSGSPAVERTDQSIYFNWRNGSPASGINSDNFSVRWTKTLNIPRTGFYQFFARADDGVRLWVDGRLKISGWRDQSPTTYGSGWLYLTKGNHNIKMEYYERGGGAYARLTMIPAFYTQFYSNRSLSGSPSWENYFTSVNFNWGYGGAYNTGRDNFSARFTTSLYLSGGKYSFCTRTDDGVRLYIDNHRVIDRWRDQAATTVCTTRSLSKGFHDIRMEYYERGGAALARLSWGRYGGVDALGLQSAAAVNDEADLTEEDILALYNDAGYLGPLTEVDLSTVDDNTVHEVFLPTVLR